MIWNWRDKYPELINKMRWSIHSTFGGSESSLTYTEAQLLATVLSQDVIDLLKLSILEPGVLAQTTSIRSYLSQKVIDSNLET